MAKILIALVTQEDSLHVCAARTDAGLNKAIMEFLTDIHADLDEKMDLEKALREIDWYVERHEVELNDEQEPD